MRNRWFESISLQRRVVQTIGSAWKAFSERDSEFESGFLQRRVRSEPRSGTGKRSSLARMLRLEMRAELKSVLSEAGTTTIYVTHDQTEAMGR